MGDNKTDRLTAFIFGVVFITTLLVLAVAFPEPTPFQYAVFRVVLSLAAAGVAAMIPGFLEVQIPTWLRAGGALALFGIVYFYNPAFLVVPRGEPDKHAQSKDSEDTRYALEQLLLTCQQGYENGRKYDELLLLEQGCFVNPSDVIVVREYWNLLGSPHYVELTLNRLTDVEDSVAEGIVISRANGEASQEIRVRFMKTASGWRISGNKLFTQLRRSNAINNVPHNHGTDAFCIGISSSRLHQENRPGV